MLVKHVPYLDSKKEVQRGLLVTKLILAGEKTTQPDDHVAYFIGEYPCNTDGTAIAKIFNQSRTRLLADGVTINHTFSAKPKPSGFYEDYYAKISTYCAVLGGPAQAIDSSVTAKTFAPVVPEEEDKSVFNYIDTASSRAEIDVITQKLALGKVAIVGLGGTGSYVLDLLAKTPVREIHLFDGDYFFTHNAFRGPGAPSLAELETLPRKVHHFAGIYSKMHRGIVPHDVSVDTDNIEVLRAMDFVFLCLDDGVAKKLIVEKLEQFGKPFVDVGMGVHVGEGSLGGHLRVTTSTPEKRDHARERISFAAGAAEDEYSHNIQIADLNALNAALAVIKWKKLFGFYLDYEKEHHSSYGIELHSLSKEDRQA